MIFDSPEMFALLVKYQNTPGYDFPEIVKLAKEDRYVGERILLESLYVSGRFCEQENWVNKFVNKNPQSFHGAWFELMLYGWLKDVFGDKIILKLMDQSPDFIVTTQGTTLMIEAYSSSKSPIKRESKRLINKIVYYLRDIKKPYSINLIIRRLVASIDINDFHQNVINWLNHDSSHDFYYKDALGNNFHLTSQYNQTLDHLDISYTVGACVNPEILKSGLIKKIKQHKAACNNINPYVIAILVNSPFFTTEELYKVLFGNNALINNLETKQTLSEKYNHKGIYFLGDGKYRSYLSGVLVFSKQYDETKKSRYLQSWFIENPYATVKVHPFIFPVEHRFTDKSVER